MFQAEGNRLDRGATSARVARALPEGGRAGNRSECGTRRSPVWLMSFSAGRGGFYIRMEVAPLVLADQVGGVYLGRGFPRVIRFGVPFPLDEVLQLFSSSMMSVALDGLDLILFFISHEVRGRLAVVFAVFFCFDIWGKEGSVEDRVDGPLGW